MGRPRSPKNPSLAWRCHYSPSLKLLEGPRTPALFLRVTQCKPHGLRCPCKLCFGRTRRDRVWRESGLQRNRAPWPETRPFTPAWFPHLAASTLRRPRKALGACQRAHFPHTPQPRTALGARTYAPWCPGAPAHRGRWCSRPAPAWRRPRRSSSAARKSRSRWWRPGCRSPPDTESPRGSCPASPPNRGSTLPAAGLPPGPSASSTEGGRAPAAPPSPQAPWAAGRRTQLKS